MRKILYYLSRVLTIGIVIFLYLFVLEAFSPGFGWQAGLMHFILATIVLLCSAFWLGKNQRSAAGCSLFRRWSAWFSLNGCFLGLLQ